MSTQTAIPHEEMVSLGVAFLDAMLSSAEVETIGRSQWWDRARTALETAAATGTRFSETVSTAARKLQINGSLSAGTSAEIHRIGEILADEEKFSAWRELCQADAVYITALTRVTRTARRDTTT